jgi:hypothetical protein
VETATRALTASADGKRPAPLITVMVDFDTFTGRVCELAAGTVVAPRAVAELLGYDETLIQRVVADGANRVRDISSARWFRGTLRRVLDVLHRRCDHKTRFVPADQCQGDHILAWSEGGLTTKDNGRLGCGPHNRWWYATGQSHPPPNDPDALLDDELDDDPGPRRTPRFMLRIALASAPDIQVGDGDERCTIDLHPLGHTTDRWRDYPIHTAA